MSGLSDEQIEQRLKALEGEVALLRQQEQRAWGLVIAFLQEQRQRARQEQAGLDRAIERLHALGE